MNRLLIVEDDKSIIAGLCEFLTSEGFVVEAVTGQRDAVKCIEENVYDLLLVDISLSDGNGFAVCGAAKEKNYPVIFLTASGDEYSVVAGLDMDYRGVPFGPMPALMAIADDVIKVHAVCVRCGAPAFISHRLVATEGQVLLGETDKYEPICRHCYNELQQNKANQE